MSLIVLLTYILSLGYLGCLATSCICLNQAGVPSSFGLESSRLKFGKAPGRICRVEYVKVTLLLSLHTSDNLINIDNIDIKWYKSILSFHWRSSLFIGPVKILTHGILNILLRIRGEVSHQAFCSINPWVFEKPYKKGRFLRVLALTKSIGF